MPYDPKCEKLAKYFLADKPKLLELAPALAQEIQDTVEYWIIEMEDDEDDSDDDLRPRLA